MHAIPSPPTLSFPLCDPERRLIIPESCLFFVFVLQVSTAVIPFYPVMVMVAMFVFIVFPLTVIGAIIGRNTASDFQAPCRTTRVPRQVRGHNARRHTGG